MAIVLSILRKSHARGTHHGLALDALADLKAERSGDWQRLFHKHIVPYLDGAKAPDTAFKDFENHVLHPRLGFWGGAVAQAETWYAETVAALARQDWPAAAYAAGVLSHYVTDPLQPLHTHQTEAENAIHSACEWTVSRTYDDLRALGLVLPIEVPDASATIADLLRYGATRASTHYETTLAHYDIKRGVVAPEEGLDAVGKRVMAEMLVCASRTYALLLDRAIAEAGVAPPDVALASDALKAFLRLPSSRRAAKLQDAATRQQIEAMYDELMATGRVEKTLPEDERKIRDLFALQQHATSIAADAADLDPEDPVGAFPATRTRVAVEVPHPAPQLVEAPRPRATRTDALPQAVEPIPAATAITAPLALAEIRPVAIEPPASAAVAPALATWRPSPSRSGARQTISLEADVVDAPSIGPKTAKRLNDVGIDTVGDFLKAHPIALSARLEDGHMTPVVLTEWQDQTRLMCMLSDLRAGDAKLLVGAGYRTVEAIINVEPDQLSADVLRFALTKDGMALLRDGNTPDVEKIRGWAADARAVKAA